MRRSLNHLTANNRDRFQLESGWGFGRLFEVQWSDLDAFGHVNHLSHLAWFENVRNAYLAELGFPLGGPTSPGPVIKQLTCSYDQPIPANIEVLVTARTISFRRTSFKMEYAIWGPGAFARAQAVCVWFLSSEERSLPLPELLRAKMFSMDQARLETGYEPQ